MAQSWAIGWHEVGQQQDLGVNAEPKRRAGSAGTEPRGRRGLQEWVEQGWEALSSRGLWAGGRLVGGTGSQVEVRLGCFKTKGG